MTESEPAFIESTAGQVSDWLAEVRQFTRPRVIGQGWSDTDIDRIIDEERDAVQPRLG